MSVDRSDLTVNHPFGPSRPMDFFFIIIYFYKIFRMTVQVSTDASVTFVCFVVSTEKSLPVTNQTSCCVVSNMFVISHSSHDSMSNVLVGFRLADAVSSKYMVYKKDPKHTMKSSISQTSAFFPEKSCLYCASSFRRKAIVEPHVSKFATET